VPRQHSTGGKAKPPLRKAAPLPIAATVAVETSGPTPGICRK
jgi:hypothetical protein